MRSLITLVLICILLVQSPAEAFLFHKKDYKQIMLNTALKAEKREDYNSAFHSFEKAMYYYNKDSSVIESYAKFCERHGYLDRATELYTKLYVQTKDKKYNFKANMCAIKNGKLSDEKIQKIISDKHLSASQKKEINKASIYHFAYKKNWQKVKSTCDKLPTKDIGIDIIQSCMIASEKAGDKKNLFKYSLRNVELSPKDSGAINKVISLAESMNDLKTEEIYVKKLSAINPKNTGIKYKLAGIYERQKKWAKAASVYKELMASGDKTEHVKNSYNYVLSEMNKKPETATSTKFSIYKPKPLSGFKLAEKQFYDAWKLKDYNNAQIYLSKMLKEKPDNKKLLKHRVDIDVSQNNFSKSILDFDKLKTDSVKDTEFLAFLYSKIGDNKKALEIVENKLHTTETEQQNRNAKEEYRYLTNLALGYALADKNWDSALNYNNILLTFDPKSEKFLKGIGDLYSIKKDFPNAIVNYERLVKYHTKLEYQKELANLYMASHDFGSAESMLGPLYLEYPEDKQITDSYLNSLLAQRKTEDAYWVIKDRKLQNTPEGYMILGDLASENKNYKTAKDYYSIALQLDPENTTIRNKLADSYRLLGFRKDAYSLYSDVLREDPQNLEARVGLGSLETDAKHFAKARLIFKSILADNPDYKPAKIGIVYSYLGNDEKFRTLQELNTLEDDNETKLLRAKVYYDMNMPTNSRNILSQSTDKDSKELKAKIKRDNAITITPTYSFMIQQLASTYRLNYQMGGINVSQNIDPNTNVFLKYNVYTYSSADFQHLNNVTNEVRGGMHGKPTQKAEYNFDLGVKAYEFGNSPMLVTDDWIKYRLNDKLALKLGFSRDNLIQSYTSAVGRYINGVFTGRVADTRTYLEYDLKLPKECYSFGRACYGVMYGQNLTTNQYAEGMLGVGKLLYNNQRNPIIQKINFDIVSFNWAFQHNLLNLYDSVQNVTFGGYFSPSFFTSNTGNLKIEGELKKLKIKYGCAGFAGIQVSRTPDFANLTWGVGPYISYKINDHIDINASYNYYSWGEMKRHVFLVNAVIRGFRKDAKN